MKVLLDECVDHRFGSDLKDHEVHTVASMGWRGKTNGELLGVAAANGFEVLVTTDQRIHSQQNLSKVGLAILVLCVYKNKLDHLRRLTPEVLRTLPTLRTGQVASIGPL